MYRESWGRDRSENLASVRGEPSFRSNNSGTPFKAKGNHQQLTRNGSNSRPPPSPPPSPVSPPSSPILEGGPFRHVSSNTHSNSTQLDQEMRYLCRRFEEFRSIVWGTARSLERDPLDTFPSYQSRTLHVYQPTHFFTFPPPELSRGTLISLPESRQFVDGLQTTGLLSAVPLIAPLGNPTRHPLTSTTWSSAPATADHSPRLADQSYAYNHDSNTDTPFAMYRSPLATPRGSDASFTPPNAFADLSRRSSSEPHDLIVEPSATHSGSHTSWGSRRGSGGQSRNLTPENQTPSVTRHDIAVSNSPPPSGTNVSEQFEGVLLRRARLRRERTVTPYSR
ncbi:hypothetical protein M427DRAFT_159894 [Gonapodya prolifera JEL478]|uniref:Uncharacterized protein n=1 Tax=Gonapodya prolifera (strain JEL478) TaxID=1344416 RepID=A0A139A102_GONPJ|nr:hypothetical protein M427DRAFT_159894 [Gonapodya prolifera JEL478]|eukprot:KXS10033.1 hypothetical protein M427DRAFT_159894 [Gonapodya prolifera JEL478]